MKPRRCLNAGTLFNIRLRAALVTYTRRFILERNNGANHHFAPVQLYGYSLVLVESLQPAESFVSFTVLDCNQDNVR